MCAARLRATARAVCGAQTMAKVAVVTGSNTGIGLEIVRLLARGATALPEGSTVYLCSRDIKRGEAARENVLNGEHNPVDITVAQLDITQRPSIDALAARIKEEHGAIDILINNAGFAFKNAATESMSEQAEKTIAVNYFGTKAVCSALFPLLRDDARVVNVGSRAGGVANWGADLRSRILSADLTIPHLEKMIDEFKTDVATGAHVKNGWPNTTYGVSKAALHGLTRIHARDIAKFTPSSGVTVNVICPGWCRTNMAGDRAPRSASEGADTPVWLATTPELLTTGKFFAERAIRDW